MYHQGNSAAAKCADDGIRQSHAGNRQDCQCRLPVQFAASFGISVGVSDTAYTKEWYIMLYYGIGSALLTAEQLIQMNYLDEIRNFSNDVLKGKVQNSELNLLTGTLTVADVRTAVMNVSTESLGRTEFMGTQLPWQPIGLNKPLTIDIREIYTGRFPQGILGRAGERSMLVASAIKSKVTQNAQPLALNMVKSQVKPKSRFKTPSATQDGTPYIFYAPALLDNSLVTDIVIDFDAFSDQLTEILSGLFRDVGAIPAFAMLNGHLLIAGQVINLISQIGNTIFDGQPTFKTTVSIDINIAGTSPQKEGPLLVVPDDTPASFATENQITNGTLINSQTKAEYRGEIPYCILGLDGSIREDLATFAPSALSASLLSRFLAIPADGSSNADTVLKALQLYNDWRFRKDIEELDKKISNETNPDTKAELQASREALLKNILNDELKP